MFLSHRGGAALYPENTMYAFERAMTAHRTDMLELDVHVSSDGEVVVAHDPTLDRCTNGSGPISALSWRELASLDAAYRFTPAGESGTPLRGKGIGIPTLRQVLEATPGLRLNVEVKTASAIELAQKLPEGCHFFPANALAAFVLPTKGGEPPEDDPRYTVLDMPYRWEGVTIFDAELTKIARERGKWINVWTVDEEVDMRRCILDGVGGVITDRPDVLRAVLSSPALA